MAAIKERWGGECTFPIRIIHICQLPNLSFFTFTVRYETSQIVYIRYPKKIFTDLLRSSVLVCLNKIEFKIFFAFMVLDAIAWLNRLGSSNFYLSFFCSLKSTIKIRTKDIVLNDSRNIKVLLTPSKNTTIKAIIWTKTLQKDAFHGSHKDFQANSSKKFVTLA